MKEQLSKILEAFFPKIPNFRVLESRQYFSHTILSKKFRSLGLEIVPECWK